jgi:hypothetical protein
MATGLADVFGAEFTVAPRLALGFPGHPNRRAEDPDGFRGGVVVTVALARNGSSELAEDDQGRLVGLVGCAQQRGAGALDLGFEHRQRGAIAPSD